MSAKEKASKASTEKEELHNKDFEVLRFNPGRATNVVKFKDTAFNFCTRELGSVARVIKDGVRYIPLEIPQPAGNNPFSAANDPSGSKKTIFLKKVSNREDEISNLQTKEPQLFAHLWTNISKESQEQIQLVSQQAMNFEGELMFVDEHGAPCDANEATAVSVMEDWNKVFGRDVLSLMRRINKTHLAPDTGVRIVDQESTKVRYETTRQFPQESILEYKRRFQNAVDSMRAVGVTDIPAPESQAVRFIYNLDNNRYSQFKAEVTNWASAGIKPYPESLEKAFEAIVQYKELSTMIQTTTGSAFVTRGRGNPRGRGRVSVDKKSPTVATPSMPASSPSPTPHTSVSTDSKVCTKPCTVCGGMHWIKSCPIVKEAAWKSQCCILKSCHQCRWCSC